MKYTNNQLIQTSDISIKTFKNRSSAFIVIYGKLKNGRITRIKWPRRFSCRFWINWQHQWGWFGILFFNEWKHFNITTWRGQQYSKCWKFFFKKPQKIRKMHQLLLKLLTKTDQISLKIWKTKAQSGKHSQLKANYYMAADESKIWNSWNKQNTPGWTGQFWGSFLLSIRKASGSEYEQDTLTSYHRSINRFLKEKKYLYSLVNDKEFEASRAVLQSKR